MDGKKKRIVWIDDQIYSPILSSYVEEFEENNFEVIKIESVDNLLSVLKIEVKKSLHAILVDIIMPYGPLDFGKSRGGLKTGLLVLEDILKEDSLKNIPIVVLSNADYYDVRDFCQEKSIKYLEKSHYFSNELVNIITELIYNIEE